MPITVMSCVSWLEAQLMGRKRRGGGGEGEEGRERGKGRKVRKEEQR